MRLVLRILGAVVLLTTAAIAQTYEIEQFPYPPELQGIGLGNYSAISNSARLVSAYTDPDFDPVGITVCGDQTNVFRVGTPLEEYTWYWGINDKLTTVGFKAGPGFGSTEAWMRTRNGDLRTFSDPQADVYL